MKKIAVLFVALFLLVSVADAATWVVKPAKIAFNDCPTGLKIVKYGLNYITSGSHKGEARVYVTVHAKDSVLRGCAYFKVYNENGRVIYKAKKRIKLFMGSDQNYTARIPASDIHGTDIRAEIGVGCNCGRGGY